MSFYIYQLVTANFTKDFN